MSVIMKDSRYLLEDDVTVSVFLGRITEPKKITELVTYSKGSEVDVSTYRLPNGKFACSYHNVTQGLRHVAVIDDEESPFVKEQSKAQKFKNTITKD